MQSSLCDLTARNLTYPIDDCKLGFLARQD
jgi:hypothetical protein